jgi:predicted phosphodiesterase
MSKLLIIPDVHGRDFWVEPCTHIDDYDKVIFLGDYHDPYPSQVSAKLSRHRLRDMFVPFIEEHKDKVICLYGNHDANYIVGNAADRMDYWHKSEIEQLIKRMNLQLIYQEDNYLFSHSGVLPEWLNNNALTLDDLKEMSFHDKSLMDVSPRRGGWHSVGSCIWGDVIEYSEQEHIPNLYQIFGHTQLGNPYIADDFACLDCRQAFELDTKTRILKPYDNGNN